MLEAGGVFSGASYEEDLPETCFGIADDLIQRNG
jgi:hypothetical protein